MGRLEKAEQFFDFATRMDLDNYNRNTREGLHTTSIAGAWMNIVCGFGGAWKVFAQGFAGLETEQGRPKLHSRLPQNWKRIRFTCRVGGETYRITVTHEKGEIEKQ